MQDSFRIDGGAEACLTIHMRITRPLFPRLVCWVAMWLASNLVASERNPVLPLWPNGAPGERNNLGEERDMTKATDGQVAGRSVIRLGNVSHPTITVYSPPSTQNTGTAVLVCPGGGYHILAMDLEGTEVCQWLTSIGVTGILLKYRVPRRPEMEKHGPPLQDAQRALGLIRHRAAELNLDPQKIGVLGFSAGGHLAAALSTNFEERTYPKVDEADTVSCRPDFTVLIYPGYLTVGEQDDRISPELTISSNTPPTFLAMTQDDPVRVEPALLYTLALQKVKVPVELHIYPTGGHGYGLRPAKEVVTTWPQRAEDWFRSRGWLEVRP